MWFSWMLLLASLATSTTSSKTTEWAHQGAAMFADLTPKEMNAVRDYLYSCSELAHPRHETSPQEEQYPPYGAALFLVSTKALRALDRGQAKPSRQARVVVQFGNQALPNVTEYIVGPMPFPRSYQVKTFKGDRPIRFESRPISTVEYEHLHGVLEKVGAKANKILQESTGFTFGNCTNRCLTYSDIAPRWVGTRRRGGHGSCCRSLWKATSFIRWASRS